MLSMHLPVMQMWADNQALKLQRRAHIMWDSDGPKTVFIVKKTGSAKTTAKLKEIAQWYAAGSRSISCLTGGVKPFVYGNPHTLLRSANAVICILIRTDFDAYASSATT